MDKTLQSTGWGQLLKSSSVKRSQGSGGHQVGHEAAISPGGKEVITYYAVQARVQPLGLGKDPATLSRSDEIHLNASPACSSHIQDRHWCTGASPKEATRRLEAESWGI